MIRCSVLKLGCGVTFLTTVNAMKAMDRDRTKRILKRTQRGVEITEGIERIDVRLHDLKIELLGLASEAILDRPIKKRGRPKGSKNKKQKLTIVRSDEGTHTKISLSACGTANVSVEEGDGT